MKPRLGEWLMVISVLGIGYVLFFFNISVATETGGESGRVVNLGLMNDRMVWLGACVGGLIAGVLIVLLDRPPARKMPPPPAGFMQPIQSALKYKALTSIQPSTSFVVWMKRLDDTYPGCAYSHAQLKWGYDLDLDPLTFIQYVSYIEACRAAT